MSGDRLSWGDREVDVDITFYAKKEESGESTLWTTKVNAHDGEIGCDIILGIPWLCKNALDVQPWRDTLKLQKDPFLILIPKKDTPGREVTRRVRRKIWKWNMTWCLV